MRHRLAMKQGYIPMSSPERFRECREGNECDLGNRPGNGERNGCKTVELRKVDEALFALPVWLE